MISKTSTIKDKHLLFQFQNANYNKLINIMLKSALLFLNLISEQSAIKT